MWETRVRSLVWKIPWRREWQPTPVFLTGEFHARRRLAGYSSWDHKSDTAERLSMHTDTSTQCLCESVRIRFSWEWQKSSKHHVVSNMLWFSYVSTISESKWSRLPSWFCSKSFKQNFATNYYVLGRKVMTNLDSIFKSRDITLPTKVRLVKAMIFPAVMYGCESTSRLYIVTLPI